MGMILFEFAWDFNLPLTNATFVMFLWLGGN
jgi:hypothetical protein